MRRAALILPLIVVLGTACATNPVTGAREFNIVSEAQEIQMGREAHQQVIRQFGVYAEKPELNRLVDAVGHRIASTSDRPNLPWTFTLLDTPMVNAMALPGGYIYITRGMVERINSEDELAGVLGHEIAHVTARHAAQRISRAQLAQFGMVLGAVVAGPEVVQQYGQLAELAVTLLFQRYSRSQETQADLVGTGYMAAARFNPVGAERMLMTLQRLSRGEASPLDRYFMSHPDPARRVRDVRGKVEEISRTTGAAFGEPSRTPYVPMLEGIITGNSTENVVIRDNTIYDRAHGMIIPAPAGWLPTTAPGVLFAMSPRGRSNMSFVAQEVENRELQGHNVQAAVRNRLEQMGLQYAGSRQAVTGSGERLPVDSWVGRTQGGQVGVETTQFPHGDHVAVFMFIAPSLSRTQSPLGEVLSRAVIDPARARSAQPARMRVGTVRSGETWADIARRATGNARDAQAVAAMNGFDQNTRPPVGMAVKLPQEVVVEA
ncbi:MAG TPA: M48 family metalloprotease [Thermoanaerobaculia bacterium]|nr:M48 family metalloprotease [Thermoanaerobaculia bacterium]